MTNLRSRLPSPSSEPSSQTRPRFAGLLRSVLLSTLFLGACGSEVSGPENPNDIVPPTIEVHTPQRGIQTGDREIFVEGVVQDDLEIKSVTVSGVPATVFPDGRFQAKVPLASGINFIQAVALDYGGNEAKDSRAALSGFFAPPEEFVDDASRIYMGASTFEVLSQTTEQIINATPAAPILEQNNPIYTKGGFSCLRAEVDAESIDYQDLDIQMTPIDGAISARVVLTRPQLDATSNHSVACIDGQASIVISADEAVFEATVQVDVVGGRFAPKIVDSSTAVRGAELTFGILPSSIMEFILGDLDLLVANSMEEFMDEELAANVGLFMNQLGETKNINALGAPLSVQARPRSATFTNLAGTLTVDMRVQSDGRMPYVVTADPLPPVDTGAGFSLSVADDAINQAMTSVWSTGMMSQEVNLARTDGSSIAGDLIDSMFVEMKLPPTVQSTQADGLYLRAGDVILTLRRGESEAKVALNVEGNLNVLVNGAELSLAMLGEPSFQLTRLDDDEAISDRDIELIMAVATTLVANDLNSLVGSFPIPSFAGTTLSTATVAPATGYLRLGGELVRL